MILINACFSFFVIDFCMKNSIFSMYRKTCYSDYTVRITAEVYEFVYN